MHNRYNDQEKSNKVVIPVRSKKGSVFIETVKVHKGDKVIWKAIDSDVTFFFPEPNLFGETLATICRGKHKELNVLLGTRKKDGEKFYYSVYHHGIKKFGEGNSSPVIIIQK